MNTTAIKIEFKEGSEVEYIEPTVISEYEVCARWGRSPRSLLSWRNKGKMPDFHRNDSRRVHYYLSDIEAIERKHPEFLA